MSKNFNKKKLPKNIKELSPEELLAILKKKKECNTKALRIVEVLCEEIVDPDWMLENLFFINQSHYEDIVTERSISKSCGYPPCRESLGEVPKQQYKISLNSKTVYDITERKKFCSSKCFKASEFLKGQLLTSPLWFRDTETQPNFKLKQERDSPNVSSSSITEGSSDICLDEKCGGEKSLADDGDEKKTFVELDASESSSIPEISEESQKELRPPDAPICTGHDSSKADEDRINPESSETFKITAVNSTKREEKISTKSKENAPLPQKDPVLKIEKCLEEWFTIGSYIHLMGEDKLREEFGDKKDFLENLKKIPPNLSHKFDDISRLFSIFNLGEPEEERSELKPLPNYSMLKAEADNLNIKVRAFYTGQLEVPSAPQNTPTSSKDEENTFANAMPLIDSYAQTALRRRVLLDHLNRMVADMTVSLGVSNLVTTADLRNLVHTFSLSAHNITFQTREWFLVAVIFIKMLSLQSKILAESLLQEETRKRTTLLLLSYNLNADYLDNLMEWLTDSERIASLIQR